MNSNPKSNEASLAQLIQAFLPYIQKRAASISVAGLDADDLVQEGLIGLFKAIEGYDNRPDTSFSTFAITCINNCITSAYRAAIRKKHLPLSSYISFEENDSVLLTTELTPEDLAIATEGYTVLRARIQDDLSMLEREVLALHLEGYDYVTMAQRLGTSAKTVDNALQRARKKLRSKH